MTYTKFKEYCKAHPVSLECVWRYGADCAADPGKLPKRMRGKRAIVAVRSFGFDLAINHPEGDEPTASELRIDAASLFELDGDVMTVYSAAPRLATPAEQALLDEWQRRREEPEFQRREELDALTDGSSTYYAEKAFFGARGKASLMTNRTYQKDEATGRELIRSTTPSEPEEAQKYDEF